MKIYKGAAVDGDDETENKRKAVVLSSSPVMFTQEMLFLLLKNIEITDRSSRRPQLRTVSTRLNQLRRLYG